MTLTTPYSATFQVGDGVTKTFPYLFDEVSSNFISVIVYNPTTDTTTIPTFTVDTDQKQVIFGDETPAPTAEEVVCIYRNTPEIQDVEFRTLQGYNAKAMENILSKIVAMIQELKSNYFSTQVLQGDPWQLDLLSSADNGATVNIDYVAKKLVKGLYFRITNGNLQVSADGSTYITMPKSADVTDFKQEETILEDLTVLRRLKYKVGGVWYNAGGVAEDVADEALEIAQEARDTANEAKETADNADSKADGALAYAQAAQDAVNNMYSKRYVFTITSGQTTLQFDESIENKQIDLYWNGQLITKTGNWTVSDDTITVLFGMEAGDTVVVFVNVIRQVVQQASLDAHNIDPTAHANIVSTLSGQLTTHTTDINAHASEFAAKATKVVVRRW